MTNAPLRIAGWLVAVALGVGCGTTTKIPVAWRDPGYQGGPFQQVFVIAVTESDGRRRVYEERLAAALSKRGVSSSASYGALPSTERLDEAQIAGAIEGGSYDGVIVSRLLGVEKETTYVPPRTYHVPSAHGGYYGYYGSSWDVVHEPGYYQTHTIVRLETNLYDVAGGDLVWSGQSETFDSGSVDDMIDSVTAAVAKRLAKEGLVP